MVSINNPQKANFPMNKQTIDGIEFNASCWPPDKNKPILLLIHGAALSKTFWDGQVMALKSVSTAIAPDLPGHGGSCGKAQTTISDYAASVVGFIRSAGISEHNIIVCGLSMGGAIVQQLLISYPELFKAGILINTGARLKVHPMIIEAIKTDFTGFIQAMPKTMASPTADPTRFEQQIFEAVESSTADISLKDFYACNQFDVMNEIDKISCPVLVLAAEHDVSTPAKYGEWLAQKIQNCTYSCIQNAGHLSPLEKPEEINGEICRFLENL